MRDRFSRVGMAALLALLTGAAAQAQAPRPSVPVVVSPEVREDRRITFRIYAPKAEAVRLVGGDLPGNGPGTALMKREDGVWEGTLGPVVPGAFRYHFNVDGVAVIDPRNPATSESVANTWSLVTVPGSEWFDTKNVPHGAVAAVTYYSTALSRFRRMHVYTPPGYEQGKGKYPVFYLLHGAGDSDASWSSVGRAGFILDNLIAAGKAKPVIVVMPAGHTRPFGPGGPPRAGGQPPRDGFVDDFTADVMPYVEKNYRVLADRQNRAIAGLSMGGGQTLSVFIPNQDKFAYVGVFSSGIFNAFRPGQQASGPSPWEEQNRSLLDDAERKKGLRLLWFGTGKDDFLLQTSRSSVELLKRHGFPVEYAETEGAHTWLVWRSYLAEFTPRLFRSGSR